MRVKKGFTLIELLVVIAIIALLMAVVIPGLKMAKKKAAGSVCMTNLKNLSIAWYAYAEDHNDNIVSSEMEAKDSKGNLIGWIGTPRENGNVMTSADFTREGPEVQDQHEMDGVRAGALYRYLESPETYHCPGDTIRRGPDTSRLYVSYCVPTCLNRNDPKNSDKYITKRTKISAPGTRFNFVESGESLRGNWIAAGHFILSAPEYNMEYGLWSPIAYNHGDSSAFAYVDGHAEMHKWHDNAVKLHYDRTLESKVYQQMVDKDSEDIRFVVSGWAFRYKQPTK